MRYTVRSFIKKYSACWIPLLVTFLCICFLPTFYHEVDDRFLEDMIRSAPYNSHSEFLKMIGTGVGYGLRALTLLFPSVNWLAVLYYGVITWGFFGVHVLLKKTRAENKGLVFLQGIFSLLQMLVVMHMTFTVVSFVGVMGTIAYGFAYVGKGKQMWHAPIVFVLGFISASVRNKREIVLVVICLSLPLLLYLVRQKKISLFCGMLVLFLVLGSMISAVFMYEKHVEAYDLQENRAFHQARAAVLDTKWFSYEEKAEALKNAGISQNDFEMIYQLLIGDTDVFSTKMLQRVASVRSISEKYNFDIKSVITSVLLNPYMICVSICMLVLLGISPKSRKYIVLLYMEVLLFCIYLYMRQRAEPRVVLPLAVITVIYMLLCINEVYLPSRLKLTAPVKRITAILLFTAAFSIIFVVQYNALYTKNADMKNKAEILSYAKTHTSYNITASAWTRNLLFSRRVVLQTKNIEPHWIHSPYGDWYSYFPYYYAEMEKQGMGTYADKALAMLLWDDTCRFLTCDEKEIDRLLLYFDEHYGIKAKAFQEEVFCGGAFSLYKFCIAEQVIK